MITLQRSGECTWDVLEHVEHSEGVDEWVLHGRIVADEDAWYVEAVVYQDIGHYFERIPRPYISRRAAEQAFTQFDKRAS